MTCFSSIQEVIEDVLKKPGIYGLVSVRDAIKYIDGIALGWSVISGQSPLPGIQKWIERKLCSKTKEHWTTILEDSLKASDAPFDELKVFFTSFFNQSDECDSCTQK
jgi:hypothetical protein